MGAKQTSDETIDPPAARITRPAGVGRRDAAHSAAGPVRADPSRFDDPSGGLRCPFQNTTPHMDTQTPLHAHSSRHCDEYPKPDGHSNSYGHSDSYGNGNQHRAS